MSMTQEAKKERAAYAREWRKKNPEKNKEYVDSYWKRKAQKAAESVNTKREEHQGI